VERVESRFARFLAVGIDTVRELLVLGKVLKNPVFGSGRRHGLLKPIIFPTVMGRLKSSLKNS
jgi:hypothetical protein